MVYGVLRFINFAHGDVFMIGAFAAIISARGCCRIHRMGDALGPIAVLVLTMLICALLGIAIEKIAYRPLRLGQNSLCSSPRSAFHCFSSTAGSCFGADPKSFPN